MVFGARMAISMFLTLWKKIIKPTGLAGRFGLEVSAGAPMNCTAEP
jgi:hypothetical protein